MPHRCLIARRLSGDPFPANWQAEGHTSLPGPVRRAHLPRAERRSVASCWSARWFLRPAIEPERPGLYRADPEQSGRRPRVCGKTCPYFVLIRGLDGMQGLLAVTNRAADDDKAVVDEPVHECCVPGPALLVPDLTRGVPLWAVDQPHGEIGHACSVRAVTDIQADPSITPAVLTATGSFGCEARALVADPASKRASVRAASVRG